MARSMHRRKIRPMTKHLLPLAAIAASSAFLSHTRAEVLFGLTVQNSLISFDSATPGTITAPLGITGLVVGDTLVGIDRRPTLGANNGVLYGFGVNLSSGEGRIYTLNTTTGMASLASTLVADPADTTAPTPFTTVAGTSFGVDFNPVPDRLRVVSNTGQNLRINVDNGTTQLDVPVGYVAGDVNFGITPVISSVAYSNNLGGATSTTLGAVDLSTSPDTFLTFANPNGGTLQTVSATGFNSTDASAYDISGLSGLPYFSFTPAGAGSSVLYTVSSGTFTSLGTIGGGVALKGLAAQVGTPTPPSVPDRGSSAALLLAGLVFVACLRRRFDRGGP